MRAAGGVAHFLVEILLRGYASDFKGFCNESHDLLVDFLNLLLSLDEFTDGIRFQNCIPGPLVVPYLLSGNLRAHGLALLQKLGQLSELAELVLRPEITEVTFDLFEKLRECRLTDDSRAQFAGFDFDWIRIGFHLRGACGAG